MTAPRLRGRWLIVARIAWVVVALFALGIFAVSIIGYWTELQRVCHEGARACSNQGLLTRTNVDQVEGLGVSVRQYAAYVIALRVVSFTVWAAVSAIIFWRKSEDRMALLVALQNLFRVLAGENSQLAIVGSTLAIAALFNPLRRRVQSFIDRRFYRRKYDARKTLEAYGKSLREVTDLEQLSGTLTPVVETTVQPEHVSLWLQSKDRGSRR